MASEKSGFAIFAKPIFAKRGRRHFASLGIGTAEASNLGITHSSGNIGNGSVAVQQPRRSAIHANTSQRLRTGFPGHCL